MENSSRWIKLEFEKTDLGYPSIVSVVTDGADWKMARYFRLPMGKTVKAGFEAQSPIGKGAKVRFRDIYIGRGEIRNLRKGI